jgi:hypothetical protein
MLFVALIQRSTLIDRRLKTMLVKDITNVDIFGKDRIVSIVQAHAERQNISFLMSS